MGCSNQVRFLKRHRDLLAGSVLEIGSRIYKPRATTVRSFVEPRVERYVGVDVQTGDGVDVLVDMTADIHWIDQHVAEYWAYRQDVLAGSFFDRVICFSVLEHCAQPWTMAENITALMRHGGICFISVPFVWKLHDYPKDYWRFTPLGVAALFPDLDFKRYPAEACADVAGKGLAIRWRSGGAMGIHKLLGRVPRGQGEGYWMEPTLINMIGVKP